MSLFTKPFYILALSSFFIFSCSSKPEQEVVSEEEKEFAIKDTQPELPVHCQSDTIAGQKYSNVIWENQKLEVSKDEKKIVGCWVAEVSEISVKTGGVTLNLNKDSKGKSVKGMDELTNNIIEALKNNDRMKTNCIWLYLYNDHTGFWSGCANMGNGTSELQALDIYTGKNKPMGITFNWYYKDNTIHIQFTDCLKVPYIKAKKFLADLRVRYWDIKLIKKSNGAYTTEEYFPEYQYKLPVRNKFSYSELTEGKIEEYQKAIID